MKKAAREIFASGFQWRRGGRCTTPVASRKVLKIIMLRRSTSRQSDDFSENQTNNQTNQTSRFRGRSPAFEVAAAVVIGQLGLPASARWPTDRSSHDARRGIPPAAVPARP